MSESKFCDFFFCNMPNGHRGDHNPHHDWRCEHVFARFRRWPIKDRWRCVRCGLVTRHYDGIDLSMSRPVHSRMSVAMKGYNTTVGQGGDQP